MKGLPQESLTDMLRIDCPYCGTRDETEFVFGGPSHVSRPSPDTDDETWSSYLFQRQNPAGVHLERWGHVYGCGCWFNIARDTRTHEILRTYAMGLPPPNLNGT
jgi:sarcosine oxidase, subunit delta